MAVWLRRMRVAAGAVDRGDHLVALGDASPSLDLAPVEHERRAAPYCVSVDPHAARRRRVVDHAGVADLATGLGVERRAVEDHVDRRRRRSACASRSRPPTSARTLAPSVSYSWRPVKSVGPSSSRSSR